MTKENRRIILLDLEILPDLRGALEQWPGLSNYPGLTLRASINSICCFGYKVLGQHKKAQCKNAWDFKSWDKSVNDDKELCKFIYDTLKDADAIVTQNGKRFDFPFIQTRLAKNDLPLLPKIVHIDTKLLARGNMYFFSNSLKHMAEQLTDTRKMENEGWPLWVKVHDKDPKAMKVMDKYCRQDVDALHKIFERLRPFANQIPNSNIFRRDGAEACPSCGGFNLRRNGFRTTKTKRYVRYLCKDCGSSSHENKKENLNL